MRDQADDRSGGSALETVWVPRRVFVTVLIGLPGIVLSSAVTGLLAAVFFDPSTAIWSRAWWRSRSS